MSSQRRALDQSSERKLPPVDLARLLATALVTVGAALLLFGSYQLVMGQLQTRTLAKLRQSAEEIAVSGRSLLDAQRRKVRELAERPELLRVVEADQAARRAVALALAELEPEVARILLLDKNVEVLDPRPWPEPDFSALAAALRAKALGDLAGPLVGGAQGSARVTWALPVGPRRGPLQDAPALLVVTFPLAPLAEVLEATRVGGYLDLRAVNAYGGSNVLAFRGSAGSDVEGAEAVELEPPLAVGYDYRRPFMLLSAGAGPGIVLLLLGVAMVTGAWLWKFRRPRRTAASSEERELAQAPVLTELVDEELREAMDFAEEIAGGGTAPGDAAAVAAEIFRAYDIRGIVGKTLTPGVARLIGQAIGSEALARDCREVVVGRDGRLSGPELTAALIEGINAAGVNVVDVGAVPTGVLYFAAHELGSGSGVMVTGSHNPPDYNGFKIMLAGDPLAAEEIEGLHRRIEAGDLASGKGGVQETDVLDEYVERIASDIQVEEPLKVVVDAGNGIAGAIAPQVLEEIGCEVIPLHCDVDGTFPNHHPDPSVPENLSDLITAVAKLDADLGLALDGDGDRLGVVSRDGDIIYPDRILMLFAEDVLLRNPGATVIYDVKCTAHLPKVILRHGGSPLMWMTGHSLMKKKLRESNAALAGEMSGHFFFQERWYGFDDGIYAGARLLEILAAAPEGVDGTFAALPGSVSTPELKVPMEEGEHFAFVERFREAGGFPDARITTIDGLRADFDDGWGLLRASNTTPCLVLRFDADNPEALARIQEQFRARMQELRPDLDLPF